MYLIVGLGNPESEYSGTRHNMGFDAVNMVVKKLELGFFNYDQKIDAEMIRAKIFDKDCMFIKPQTYMNLSGDSIRRVVNYYKIPEENIIVVYDDMDTPKAEIRIRESGGSAGHNGVKSVLSVIQNFTRIRIGIGKCLINDDRAHIDYVTKRVPDEELSLLRKGANKASDAIIDILKTDVQTAMNKYNHKQRKEKEKDKIKEDKENNEDNEDNKNNEDNKLKSFG